MSIILKYIIVDDDPVTNSISRVRIKSMIGADVDIRIFTIPEAGLAYLHHEYSKDLKPAILFLDINMPSITGWEFLEEFDKFSEELKKHISIYMLSSSVDQRDKDRAEANKYVRGFISKPLSREMILSVANVESL